MTTTIINIITIIVTFLNCSFAFYLFIYLYICLFVCLFVYFCFILFLLFITTIMIVILQVVALQLGRGHTATAICCARLPTSSVTSLHHLPGPPPPEKEFVVVASYVSQPKASQGSQAGPAHTPSQGLMFVFEVCTAGTAGQTTAAASNRLAAECSSATAACVACGV